MEMNRSMNKSEGAPGTGGRGKPEAFGRGLEMSAVCFFGASLEQATVALHLPFLSIHNSIFSPVRMTPSKC